MVCVCECVWFRPPDFTPFQNEAKIGFKKRHAFHPLFTGFKYVSECCKEGAGEGNRTLTTSLEGWSSTIELHPHGNQNAACIMHGSFDEIKSFSPQRGGTDVLPGP